MERFISSIRLVKEPIWSVWKGEIVYSGGPIIIQKFGETRTDRFLNLASSYFLPFRTYGGFANETLKQEELRKLIESLKRDNVQFVDKPFYSVTYDPPFKLINRRNEVWVLKSLPQ